MVGALILLAVVPVAALGAQPIAADQPSGPRLSVRQLKGRHGDIFGYETGTMGDGRAYCSARVKTLPESDVLAALVNDNDLFLSFLQVNGVDCWGLLPKGVTAKKFHARCLDRMRASRDVDAALLPAIDRYLRSRGGGLDDYESGPPATIAMCDLVSVAVRFFYPDTILPDGAVQAHICVGLNGLKDLQTPRDLAVEAFAAGVILRDAKAEKHPLQDEFGETLGRIIRLDLSSDPKVRLTRIQGALWASLAESRRLRRSLRREYERSRDWLPFVLVEASEEP